MFLLPLGLMILTMNCVH